MSDTASWYISANGKAIVRVRGVVIYDGEEATMPPDIRVIADTFTVPSSEAIPVLLGERQASDE